MKKFLDSKDLIHFFRFLHFILLDFFGVASGNNEKIQYVLYIEDGEREKKTFFQSNKFSIFYFIRYSFIEDVQLNGILCANMRVSV